MNQSSYAVIFAGRASPGEAIEQVKSRVASLLKLRPDQLATLFSGKRVAIRRGLSLAQAQKLKILFERTGALCVIVPQAASADVARGPHAAADGTPVVLSVDNLDRFFAGRLSVTPPRPRYQFSLMAVAAVLIALPLAYVSLVVAVGTFAVWHAFNGLPPFDLLRLSDFLFSYAVPVAAAGLVFIALVKPLFAREPAALRPVCLNRKNEPLFFAFVDKICDTVGAPRPARIQVDGDVNASAAFAPGIAAFLRRELVLTVGTPLFAGLNTRQLAGVLAHEFGHFSQRAGMGATYIIYGVSLWLYRCVNHRDAWDDWLDRAAQNWNSVSGLIVGVAQNAIAIARLLLVGLLWVANVVTRFLSREMELDADRYEAMLIGSHQFRDTAYRLRLLGHAMDDVMEDLARAWADRKLVDNLPELLAKRARELEPRLAQDVWRDLNDERMGLHDTHPPDATRIQAAERLRAKGVFAYAAPARILLENYATFARQTTLHFYRANLDRGIRQDQLISLDALKTVVQQERATEAALSGYFHGLFDPRHFFQAIDLRHAAALAPQARATQLSEVIAQVRAMLPDIPRLAANHAKAEKDLILAYAAVAVAAYTQDTRAQAAYDRAGASHESLQRDWAPLEAMFLRRLALGLAQAGAGGGAAAAEIARLIRAQAGVAPLHPTFLAAYREAVAIQRLVELAQSSIQVPASTFTARLQQLKRDIERLESGLAGMAYPFARGGGQDATVLKHLTEELPMAASAQDTPAYLAYAYGLLEALARLNARIVGRLAVIAGDAEAGLGLRVRLIAAAGAPVGQ